MPASEVRESLRMRYGAEDFALGAEVKPESLLEALRTLRDAHGYRFYITGTAIDRDEEIEVLHGVRNLDSGDEFFVKVRLPRQAPEVASAAFQFAGAEWHEREVLDLFGVSFDSHPDPRRILMPDAYEGHPLRKDFPMDTPWGYRPPTEKDA
jgi:NADH:ubiquinone oxidoreductase subunit C